MDSYLGALPICLRKWKKEFGSYTSMKSYQDYADTARGNPICMLHIRIIRECVQVEIGASCPFLPTQRIRIDNRKLNNDPDVLNIRLGRQKGSGLNNLLNPLAISPFSWLYSGLMDRF